MRTPRIEINLKKIAHNAKTLKSLYSKKGIEIIGVTKVVCGNPNIASTLVKSGINILADSRLINIRKLRNAGIKAEFLLLRTPFLNQVEAVVKYVDISFNTELAVIKKLSKFAIRNNTKHKIILMVELGDLREGIMPDDLDGIVKKVLELSGIELVGIGTNLACFGGIKPDNEKMEYLSSIVQNVEKKFGLNLKFVSGGNSANYEWFSSASDVGKINNLRIGESIYLGRETLHRNPIPGLYTDAFTLVAEVIESKTKPSIPYGEIAQNAFGSIPEFKEVGNIKRSILGIGMQDVLVSGLKPRDDFEIIGASSDHIILDTSRIELKIGSELEFDLNYGALLSVMTSPYVLKQTGVNFWKLKNIAKAWNNTTENNKNSSQPSLLMKTNPH